MAAIAMAVDVGVAIIEIHDPGEGRIERTQPLLFSADETADVGIDLQTPVVEALGAGDDNRFTGRIPRVTVSLTPSP